MWHCGINYQEVPMQRTSFQYLFFKMMLLDEKQIAQTSKLKAEVSASEQCCHVSQPPVGFVTSKQDCQVRIQSETSMCEKPRSHLNAYS